ncbi:MAG TPA: hypothetical protein VHQ65_13025 [Thermoanaerobaculia bacterium]|nr:hypothetical protein [Thermoanaerobaculia bacterium]
MNETFGDAVAAAQAGLPEVRIELEAGRTAYEPGQEVRGTAWWRLERPAVGVALHLRWTTAGRGDEDSELVRTLELPAGGAAGRAPFQMRLPDGPYSFSGKLVSLTWHLELVAEPELASHRVELVIAPGGREVRLHASP